jgi:hypothetical protein
VHILPLLAPQLDLSFWFADLPLGLRPLLFLFLRLLGQFLFLAPSF